MAIDRRLRVNWLERGDKITTGGLIVSTDQGLLFSDEPKIFVKPAADIVPDHGINLFVRCTFPDRFSLPTKPAFKLVGDPERGTSRQVYEYIGKDSGFDFRLGLTVHNARGTWSSEPHDFEIESLKSFKPMRFWEQFAYITDPPNEWGIQTRRGVMADGSQINDGIAIRDRDIVDIPLGVHMVTAGPGVKLAYIWIYQAEDISAAEKF